MNHKIPAITAIVVLLAGIMTTGMANLAYAQASKDTAKMKTKEKTTDVK